MYTHNIATHIPFIYQHNFTCSRSKKIDQRVFLVKKENDRHSVFMDHVKLQQYVGRDTWIYSKKVTRLMDRGLV